MRAALTRRTLGQPWTGGWEGRTMIGYPEAYKAWWLTRGMARISGVNLSRAVVEGWLQRAELDGLVTRCATCKMAENAKAGWRARVRPGPCRTSARTSRASRRWAGELRWTLPTFRYPLGSTSGSQQIGTGMRYRREIDGLRAIAVLPVILFHAGFTTFSGGFVGVDVFFVISGYLITSILLEEMEAGSLSISQFYERRARRILPALFLVVLACLPFAYMWMLPSQLKDFAASIVTVVLALSNLYFLSQVDSSPRQPSFSPCFTRGAWPSKSSTTFCFRLCC